MRPETGDYPSYYSAYINLVKQEEVKAALHEIMAAALSFIKTIPSSVENYAYAEGKWTVREVLLHCADTERIFCYRTLGYARGEKQKALSFEETDYAANSRANQRSLTSIVNELETVNKATLALFDSFDAEVLGASGETPAGHATVNAMGFMIAGHLLHHLDILRTRYLSEIKFIN